MKYLLKLYKQSIEDIKQLVSYVPITYLSKSPNFVKTVKQLFSF